MMKVLLILLGALVALVILAWVGLQIRPAPFHAFPQEGSKPVTVPLPQDLPAPVARFYREVYGESVPVIESFVITGRAQMRVRGRGAPGGPGG
jgi:hypothetical protein